MRIKRYNIYYYSGKRISLSTENTQIDYILALHRNKTLNLNERYRVGALSHSESWQFTRSGLYQLLVSIIQKKCALIFLVTKNST